MYVAQIHEPTLDWTRKKKYGENRDLTEEIKPRMSWL